MSYLIKLISKIKDYIRDKNNIDNYLAWSLDYKNDCLSCNYDRFEINVNDIKKW